MAMFALRLPPDFDREASIYCDHGGEYYVRGQERIGYCHGWFDAVPPAGSGKEEAFTLLGRPAILSCSHGDHSWSATVAPVGPAGFTTVVYIAVRERATLAQVLGALQSATASS